MTFDEQSDTGKIDGDVQSRNEAAKSKIVSLVTYHRFPILLLTVCGGLLVFLVNGCDDPATSTGPLQGKATVGDKRGQLFQAVATNLNQLETFPAERMLPLLRDQLNHWRRESKPEVAWELDPVVKSLPESLRDLPEVKRIDAPDYDPADMEFLMESVWLRDIARTARGEGFNDIAIATRLFDWTIRNLQIAPDTPEKDAVTNHSMNEILLLGRATAIERAWVFIRLCRQQGLDAVMLAIPGEKDKNDLRPWLPAVRIKEELYLFDPRLGLPIPGPKGALVATLSQVAADDALLRALDLDREHPYPVKSSDLQSVVALVETSPDNLALGMKLIESRLTGDERVVLTTSPSKLIDALKKLKHVGDARLWLLPYEVLENRGKRTDDERRAAMREMLVFLGNPPLYRGRIRQFKGNLEGEQGAKTFYLQARPSQAEIDKASISPEQKKFVTEMKQDATYWLGLIAFDEKAYPSAVDWLRERVLIASPQGPWTSGARYNLGRTYEVLGDKENAVAQYYLDKSPQSTGNKLRARQLMAKPSSTPN